MDFKEKTTKGAKMGGWLVTSINHPWIRPCYYNSFIGDSSPRLLYGDVRHYECLWPS